LANRSAGHSGLSVSPDGRWVLYTALGMDEADIMLVEGFH
jgi:hypothetical protein